jgi:hypothetical protein
MPDRRVSDPLYCAFEALVWVGCVMVLLVPRGREAGLAPVALIMLLLGV